MRRVSGGVAIVAGPGCLMYALILSYARRPALQTVSNAHRWVLETLTAASARHVPEVERRGVSDLTMGRRKFSGNSVRCRRRHLLYHGTLLYDFPTSLVSQCLLMPPRMPDYRENRPHDDFVANLPLRPDTIRRLLIEAFDAREACAVWPERRTAALMVEKYGRPEWNWGRQGSGAQQNPQTPHLSFFQ